MPPHLYFQDGHFSLLSFYLYYQALARISRARCAASNNFIYRRASRARYAAMSRFIREVREAFLIAFSRTCFRKHAGPLPRSGASAAPLKQVCSFSQSFTGRGLFISLLRLRPPAEQIFDIFRERRLPALPP